MPSRSVVAGLAGGLTKCQQQIPRTRTPMDLNATAFAPDGVLVHLHYYEAESMPKCELLNKRTNLVQLIERAMVPSLLNSKVTFHVTSSGNALPDLATFYESIGAMPPHSRSTLFPANVRFTVVENTPTDLCPRAAVIQGATATPPSFVLFLNDGSRGPFLASDGSSSSAAGAAYGLPAWLARYAAAFGNDDLVRVVGPSLSCELNLHLQSWALMVDWRAIGHFLGPYQETCRHGLPKTEAIAIGEVSPHKRVLDDGFAMTSFFPGVAGITASDYDCFLAEVETVKRGPHGETWYIPPCVNPYDKEFDAEWGDLPCNDNRAVARTTLDPPAYSFPRR